MKKEHYGYGFYIKYINKEIRRIFDERFKCYDITKSQMDVLIFLQEHCNEDISQKDVQDYLHISNPTVTGLVNRLEEKGFITRSTSHEDKRLRYLRLTDAGMKICQDNYDTLLFLESKLVDGLNTEQKKELLVSLQTMYNNLVKEEHTC